MDEDTSNISKLSKPLRFLLLFFLFLGFIHFIARGPIRALNDSNDFAIIYLASTLWLQGSNPYDHVLFYRTWSKAGGLPIDMPILRDRPSVYPITTFPIVAPLTLLDWPRAMQLWTFLNSLAFLIQVILITIFIKFGKSDWRSILLFGISLNFAPIHTSIAMGQPTVIAFCCILGGIWAADQKREVLSGFLMAISFCLKPQIGLFFILYYLIIGNKKLILSCSFVVLLIAAVGILRFGTNDFSWLIYWRNNLNASFGLGSTNDYSSANIGSKTFINLHYLLFSIINNRIIVDFSVYLIIGIELIVFYKNMIFNIKNYNNLLDLSAIAIILLLGTYHRFYDAAILLLPIAVAVRYASSNNNKIGILILLLFIPFFAPGQVMIAHLKEVGIIPFSWTTNWFWNSVAMTHQVWILFFQSILFIYLMIARKQKELAVSGQLTVVS